MNDPFTVDSKQQTANSRRVLDNFDHSSGIHLQVGKGGLPPLFAVCFSIHDLRFTIHGFLLQRLNQTNKGKNS